MKTSLTKLKSDIPFYAVAIIILYILFGLYSCKTLQKTEGFEKYPQNTDWEIHKL